MTRMKLNDRHKAFLCVLCGVVFLLFGCPDETLQSPYTGRPCELEPWRSPAARKVEDSNISPGEPSLLWVSRFRTESPPTVDGGIVFSVSDKERLYALDAATGDMRWCHQVGAPVDSSLAAANGIIYFYAWDHYVYGLDALTGKKVLRTFSTIGDAFRSSLTVVDGVIYHVSDAGVEARKTANGRRKWYSRRRVMESRGPTAADGIVYVTFVGDHDDYILALDAATGQELWHYYDAASWPYWPFYSTVVHGMLYVASSDNVYALDAASGELRWRYEVEGPVTSAPTVDEGLAYVGTRTGYVYALDAVSGALRWSYETGGWVDSSPVVTDGTVYVGAHNGQVFALDALTGAVQWRYKVPVIVDSTPAVVGVDQGIVYFVADGNVHALDATGARTIPAPQAEATVPRN